MERPYYFFLLRLYKSKQVFIIRWIMLSIFSLISTLVLDFFHIPAQIMLGFMLAGVVFAIGGSRLGLPKFFFFCAQAVIGCLSSSRIDSSIISSFLSHWFLFLSIVLITIMVSTALGIFASRMKLFPGTTAIWGISPGASATMIVMAASYGGDPRLVAFMQYIRVIFVALIATAVAKLFMDAPVPSGQGISALFPLFGKEWFPSYHWHNFAATLLLIIGSGILGKVTKLPGGCMLLPMIFGAVFHGSGVIEELVLPEWLLSASYIILGWNVGLGFTREILHYAFKLFPRILLFVVILIGFGGALAWLLNAFLGVDPLTAYLSTSPGGMDTIAIIAASVNVDLPFVMTLQSLRLILVVLIGPYLSHFIAKKLKE